MLDVTTCRAPECRALIEFRKTPKGATCPYDVVSKVLCEACGAEGTETERGTVCACARGRFVLRFVSTDVSHYATCKAPKRFSKKGRAA